MRSRIQSRWAVFCSVLVLFGTTVSVTSVLTGSTAGADTENASGTHWVTTGWVREGFFSFYNDGDPIDPVYSWAYYTGGVNWEEWSSSSGAGSYDKLPQDYWTGLLGTEDDSGAPNGIEDADIYAASYGTIHYDSGTDIATLYGDGTCPEEADPIFIPCDESTKNTNGHHYTHPVDSGYIDYASNYGYPPVYFNGAQTLTVLSGFIS